MTTQISIDSAMNDALPQAEFVKLFKDEGGREYFSDFEWHRRLGYLSEQIEIRNGTDDAVGVERVIPNQFVVQQALQRYFTLVNDALKDLKFSRDDLTIILNTTCGPNWQWDLGHNVASMVADENGIDSLQEISPDSSMRLLLENLIALTQLQNAALVDFCEKFWRARKELPFEELCAKLGLQLVDKGNF